MVTSHALFSSDDVLASRAHMRVYGGRRGGEGAKKSGHGRSLRGVPLPRVPEENPMSGAKVELGRHLFYDTRLSANQTQSCASCHKQEIAFTDGRPSALGSTGEDHVRSSMSLANSAFSSTFGWSNPSTLSLEAQAAIPIFNEQPIELGLSSIPPEEFIERLATEPRYHDLFAKAWPKDEAPITLTHVTQALASFQRTLLSFDSPYDRYVFGRDESALSTKAKRGMGLFFSERLECFHCHGGPDLL